MGGGFCSGKTSTITKRRLRKSALCVADTFTVTTQNYKITIAPTAGPRWTEVLTMRLIDADTLDIAKEVETVCKALGLGEKSAFEGFVTGWLTGAIAKAPAIDAVPVVRGEWEYEHGAWCCSKCGEI